MTRYHQKNPFNNRVIVDYESRTVTFDPVGVKSIIHYWLRFYLQLMSVPLYAMVLFLMIGIPLLIRLPAVQLEELLIVLYTCFGLLYCAMLICSLVYFIPQWRHSYFPRFNAFVVGVTYFLMNFSRIQKRKVLPSAVVNKTFYVSDFSNVELHYQAIGDMKKQLKRIRIDTVYDDDPWHWYFVFEFKKQPVDGFLMVSYQ